MTVNIQFVHMNTSEWLTESVNKHLEKLADKFQFIIRGDVTFKKGNSNDGIDKICEMELSAPGPRLFAKSTTDNFEKSVMETVKELEKQLRKRKEKFENH